MYLTAELGLSWRLDSMKKHSQRALFRDGRSAGNFVHQSAITLGIHHQRCHRINAYTTVELLRCLLPAN